MPGIIQPELPLQGEESELIDLWRKARKLIEEGDLSTGELYLDQCKKIIGTVNDYLK